MIPGLKPKTGPKRGQAPGTKRNQFLPSSSFDTFSEKEMQEKMAAEYEM
jgi:hypothetical protein